jgi:uncharacterized protein (DUF2126 family)
MSPYSLVQDEVLHGLREQGRFADNLLAKAGLVLTQGGEPTFLPENPTAPEWNLEALGSEKLSLAWRLCSELRETLMPGALILLSNGKQYPGEPIPRWKLVMLRGPDGPLWKNQDLLLEARSPGGMGRTPVTPRRFLSVLSEDLGLTGALQPVYEDIELAMRQALQNGGSAPVPRYSRRRKSFVQPRWSTAERKLWQSLHSAAGWVLPLGRNEEGWITADWSPSEGEDLVLLPGTSSIGLRLPLHRLPAGVLSCAITAEIRDGSLSVFLPPLPDAASFAELVAAVERTAEHLGTETLSLEGYPPPEAEGWESLSVIPDPGVIEVNLPPAADWNSLERTAGALFRAAERATLRGTRTLPSGEVVPTGGGGHLVLGGPSPDRNPFLLSPSLLPSFLRFIQNHPVLSYLFSGRFMGPSSQAPRVDESFFEIPRELETALRAIEAMPPPADPPLIDAILRNLLLDLHGNTHRAEISIDKFHNPFMPNGRLGLVEFRAIEMSPDLPSFLAVQSLWRALAASFATLPYREPLIDWKGRLHEDFLLPSRLEQNLAEVLAYLERGGFSFRMEWFDPFLRFRFPIIAEQAVGNGYLRLRRAAEPWPLLGEQPSPAGGVVRCVDSSTERLELHFGGLAGNLRVTVNGLPLPLKPHPEEGVLGAVRFRSVWLPTCLHPQVAPHTPLEIALLDGEEETLGVWHYLDRPVAGEGASGRLVRGERIWKRRSAAESARDGTLDLLTLSVP